uniref:Uncharacterized protein n=1 Tax=Plectus sambesii TaxID=2011161 RepID=A0A914UQS9_9BILA
EVGRVHMKRLSSRSSCPDAVKSGNAWRKTKEQKKWKPVYLMLTDAGGGQLFCFESEKRAKPKLVLDLCYCHLYQIDESLFGRPNCLQLLINGMDQSAVFFCFNGDDDCVEWQSFLKPLCLGYRQSGSPFSSIRNFQTKRSLIRRKHFVQLLVHEAKNLSSKAESQFYCIAVINGAKIARTQSVAASQKSETAVWDASFLLEDIPSGCSTLQFQLRSTQNGKSKDRIVGTTTTVDMSMEKSLVGLTLFPLPAKNAMSRSIYESLGTWQLRVSAERSELLVLPEEEYSSLKELLTANSFALCHWLGCRLNVEKRQRLANALINVFSTGGVYLNLINDELDRELALSVFAQ